MTGHDGTGQRSLPELDRAALRAHLRRRHPWLTETEMGPQAVSAGECDGCGHEARLVQPCGPPPACVAPAAGPDWALGRRCAVATGTDGWCEGHLDEAAEALAWLAGLPDEADLVTRLWWLATGEVRPDPELVGLAIALQASTYPGH